MTADEVLLAGVTEHLTISAYFPEGEMFNQTTKQVEPFAAQYLSIPAYLLMKIEARGRVTVTHAMDTAGNTSYSPLVECTREQLRVLACHANELIAKLVALQAAAADEAAAAKAERHPGGGKASRREGITKGEAIVAFSRTVEIDLGSALEDGKKWIVPACVRKGSPGGKHPSLWCPVMLAVCLYEKHGVDKLQLNKVFRDLDFLASWRDEWREKAEDM